MIRSYSGYNFTVHCSKVCIDFMDCTDSMVCIDSKVCIDAKVHVCIDTAVCNTGHSFGVLHYRNTKYRNAGVHLYRVTGITFPSNFV